MARRPPAGCASPCRSCPAPLQLSGVTAGLSHHAPRRRPASIVRAADPVSRMRPIWPFRLDARPEASGCHAGCRVGQVPGQPAIRGGTGRRGGTKPVAQPAQSPDNERADPARPKRSIPVPAQWGRQPLMCGHLLPPGQPGEHGEHPGELRISPGYPVAYPAQRPQLAAGHVDRPPRDRAVNSRVDSATVW